jgi:hypothetical protein
LTTLSARASGQVPRGRSAGIGARVSDRPRDLQEVILAMVDGTRIRGMLHRAPGTRTLDFLNRQSEGFVAMTEATVVHGESTEQVPFAAINKAHIVQVIEAAAED